MATNFSPCKGSYVLNQFPSNVMFGMNGFYISASGAIQGHRGPHVFSFHMVFNAQDFISRHCTAELEIIFGLKAFLPPKIFVIANFELFNASAAYFLDDFSQFVTPSQLEQYLSHNRIFTFFSNETLKLSFLQYSSQSLEYFVWEILTTGPFIKVFYNIIGKIALKKMETI